MPTRSRPPRGANATAGVEPREGLLQEPAPSQSLSLAGVEPREEALKEPSPAQAHSVAGVRPREQVLKEPASARMSAPRLRLSAEEEPRLTRACRPRPDTKSVESRVPRGRHRVLRWPRPFRAWGRWHNWPDRDSHRRRAEEPGRSGLDS